jgi:glucose-1-phosphate adenylyltransferase
MTLALILAGGQGTRLGVLTKNIAKPAVPFGGKYRIIDFPLSNCINSGIYTVGVLTQYKPRVLNSHIGVGKAWDLDRKDKGVDILAPYMAEAKGEWYRSTANAVYQNIDYIDTYNPEYVLILSGDHIYSMDYKKMINFHRSKHADATVAVIKVPKEEASRFGTVVVDEDFRVVDFEEKVPNPKSDLASMGIYVFEWNILKKILMEDNEDPDSSNDFGKDIFPKMVKSGMRVFSYSFSGYWRDVGTIQSFWEANLDLTRPTPKLNLRDRSWIIYTHSQEMPPAYIASPAKVVMSLISEGCEVYGEVENSVIFQGVYVGKNTTVKNSIVMSNVVIGDNCYIENCIISENCIINDAVKMGIGENIINKRFPKYYNTGLTVIGENSVIPKGTVIGKNVMIDIKIKEKDFPSKNILSGESVINEN